LTLPSRIGTGTPHAKAAIAAEAADLVFHLQVALAHHGVEWRDVQRVLADRRGAPRRPGA
jgi:phosphoribosyl-ATP pyrophosphohydrolase